MSDTNAIWVYASHHGGRVDAVAFELLGKAHALASQAGAPVEALLFGHGLDAVAGQLLRAGASTIRVVDHPCLAPFSTVLHAEAVADVASKHRPAVLLLGADNENAALAARVAARLGTGLSAHCVDLKLERDLLVQTVPGFGGQLMANIVCPRARPQMATVTAGVFRPVTTTAEAAIVAEPLASPPRGRAAREVARQRHVEAAGASLASAETVVAGGFGVGSKENWALVEELAGEWHAAVGATRPPVDEGWAAADQMIGASGKFVAPRLYVALGISGMMHHVCGIHGARMIVAINSDPKAAIFGMSDYGVVGDVREVVPALLRQIRDRRGPGAGHPAAGPDEAARGVQGEPPPPETQHVQAGPAHRGPSRGPRHLPHRRGARADLRGGPRPALPGAADDDLAPDREADLALPVGDPVAGGHAGEQPDEAVDVPAHRQLHGRAVRRLGGAQRDVVRDLGHRRRVRRRLPRAPEGVARRRAGSRHHARAAR